MKIWANSADSHLLEPYDLFRQRMPAELADRMPRSEPDPDGDWETVHIDGQSFRRRLPRGYDDLGGKTMKEFQNERAPGANDPVLRLADLDQEGIWAELIYPSLGMWSGSITDAVLLREGVRATNDWAAEFQKHSPRYVCTASLPLLVIDDAVAELERAAAMGFHAVFLPTAPPNGQDPWHARAWEPLWAAAQAAGMVLGVHIGTEPHDAAGHTGVQFRGPGGAVLNYVETTYGGQRIVTQLIASGALDRHPGLKVLISEGGATWGPFIGDRMNEAYRQHGVAVRPALSKPPKGFLYEQVYASFQHDESAVQACAAMGWQNVLWGSDYPHMEGTFGHTQETLHELFDGVAESVRHRITIGAFNELFPHVGPPPAA
jgi:predicted TIM-barrel fold metal-dependent hydrolase